MPRGQEMLTCRMPKIDMESVLQRLDSAIKSRYPTNGQTMLANALKEREIKITQQAISKYLKSGKKPASWLPEACEELRVSLEWIKYGRYEDAPKAAQGFGDTGYTRKVWDKVTTGQVIDLLDKLPEEEQKKILNYLSSQVQALPGKKKGS